MSVVEPPLNKRGPNWQRSREYVQFVDPVVPKDSSELVTEIAIRLRKLETTLSRLVVK